MNGQKAWVSALRILAARRLTEAQLRIKLRRREFSEFDIEYAIGRARLEKFIDDRIYVTLYIETQSGILGDRRIIGNLVKRGIDREIVLAALAASDKLEPTRLEAAYEKLCRTRSNLNPAAAARSLSRLGFPASSIYRFFQSRSVLFFEADQ